MSLISTFSILLWVTTTTATAEGPMCTGIVTDDFENCTSNSTEHLAYKSSLKDHCKQSLHSNNNNKDGACHHSNNVCGHVFTLSHFPQQLLSTTMKDAVLNMLVRCCGQCHRCRPVREFTNISQLTPEHMNESDIIFPVLGHTKLDRLYGYYFIPIFEVPSAFYFTLPVSGNQKMIKVIRSCLSMWPLLLICILMSLISGFLTWAMETRVNGEQFPRPFHTGLFEGFWWGFVSMTTVGYGDKTPKTPAGRMFAVLWILIGITVCSIFTASLTTEIINARKSSDPDMVGKKVGILRHRLHDSTLVAQHGGIIQIIDEEKTTLGIQTMMKMLTEHRIKGFVINRNTYYFFIRRKKEMAKGLKQMTKTEKFIKGEQVSAGILVKNRAQYEFFKKYFETNRLQLQSCHDLRLNYKKTEDIHGKNSLFSPDGGLFTSFLYYSIGILVMIFCFGFCYEVRRKYIARKYTRTDSDAVDEDGPFYNKIRLLQVLRCTK